MEDISKRLAEIETKIFMLQNDWQKEPYHSEQTEKIFAAISKAQGEYPSLDANSINPHFKGNYADWNALLAPILPILSKYELAIVQEPRLIFIGSTPMHILYSIVTHSSGQWISARSLIQPEKPGNQGYGAALSYKKRYDGSALLGITFDKDTTDDDGENERKYIEKKKPVTENDLHKFYPNIQKVTELIIPEQVHELQHELIDHPDIAQMILEKLNINSLADMQKSHFQNVIKKIRDIKQAKEKATT